MTRLAHLELLAVLVGAVACPRPLDPADYTRTCDVNSDCVSLNFGDVCDSCAHDHRAINVDDLEAFEADRNAALAQCGPRLPETRECIFIPLNIPTCVDGTCAHDDDGEQCIDSPCIGIDDGENP
jgi:hypothetical protein